MKCADCLLAVGCSLVAGITCAPRAEPVAPSASQSGGAASMPAPQAEAVPAAAAEPAKLAEPDDTPTAPELPPEPTKTEAGDAKQAVAEVCNALCETAAKECTSRSARTCRANCQRYLEIADRCEGQVLDALECQARVPGLICSNVVGECAGQFRALTACESGQPRDKSPSAVPRAELPAGWTRLEDVEAGFSVALPKLVAPKNEKGNRTWRVQSGTGVSYVVSVMPPFKTEVTDKNLVRKVVGLVGVACQKDMKIHGRFEESGKTAVRFDTKCGHGDAWHGMLRISGQHVIMTAEIVPQGASATGDPFYFSFSYL